MFAESARMAQSFDGYTVQDKDKRLKETCRDFEAMFYDQIFKTMRSSVMDSGLIKKNAGERIFTEMLDSELSVQAASQSKGGLGDLLFNQLKKYIPGSDHGNNFPAETKTDRTNPYNAHQKAIGHKNHNGIDVAI